MFWRRPSLLIVTGIICAPILGALGWSLGTKAQSAGAENAFVSQRSKASEYEHPQCRPDLDCYTHGRRRQFDTRCMDEIRKTSGDTMIFGIGTYGPNFFDPQNWVDQDKGIVRMTGDYAYPRAGGGRTVRDRMTYECVVDYSSDQVISGRLLSERLVRP